MLHFYILLKMTVFAIIAKSCSTLLEAGRADKLTIGMEKLEVSFANLGSHQSDITAVRTPAQFYVSVPFQ